MGHTWQHAGMRGGIAQTAAGKHEDSRYKTEQKTDGMTASYITDVNSGFGTARVGWGLGGSVTLTAGRCRSSTQWASRSAYHKKLEETGAKRDIWGQPAD